MLTYKFKHNSADGFFYYASVVFPVAVYFIYLSTIIDNRDILVDSYHDDLFLFLKISWLAGISIVPVSFVAWLFLGSPLKNDERNLIDYYKKGWNPDKKLIVTYVSRGENKRALSRSVGKSHALLRKMDVKFDIELVTDISVDDKIKYDFDNVYISTVPETYITQMSAKYKARALHFMLEERRKRYFGKKLENIWIFHLDEESVLTPEVVAGVAKFIDEPSNKKTIGQGEIKYNAHGYFKNYLIGAMDSMRTGDDLGRFRFQFKILKMPLFGMHGSFMLIPALVEEHIGFDLGGNGSITEDAYFALLAYEKGYTFGWVEGYIREQSPFTIKDIIRQRRRWLCGLSILAFDKKIAFKRRFYLICSLVLWKISWFAVFVTLANFMLGGTYFPLGLIIFSAVMTSGYYSAYMVGIYRNLLDMKFTRFKKICLYLITFILVPVSAFVESIAVIYAIIRPVRVFEIVKK